MGAGVEFVAGDRLDDAGVGFLVADLVVLPPPEDADPQGWGDDTDGETDAFLAELPDADGWPLAAEEGLAVVDDGALGVGTFFSPFFFKAVHHFWREGRECGRKGARSERHVVTYQACLHTMCTHHMFLE